MRIQLRRKWFYTGTLLLAFVVYSPCRALAPQQNREASYLFRITEGLNSPIRITIDSRGNIYVVDTYQNTICKYDSLGHFLDRINTVNSVLGIVAGKRQSIFVGNQSAGNVSQLDSNGVIVSAFGSFDFPSSLCIDDEGNIYVVDSKNNTVFVYDSLGTEIRQFGSNRLTFPTAIAFDQVNQRILVGDHGGLEVDDSSGTPAIIHCFNKSGEWLNSIGEYGDQEGQLTRIQGIAVDDDGRVYVADPYQGIISVMDENGYFLCTIGQYGTAPGELRMPMGIAIDSNYRLWVTVMNNSCLEVFDIHDIPFHLTQDDIPVLPDRTRLLPNYPNPFNRGTCLPFELAEEGPVSINIYNALGQRVRSRNLGNKKPGSYFSKGRAYYWDGTNDFGQIVASGIYIYELRSAGSVFRRRMLLLK